LNDIIFEGGGGASDLHEGLLMRETIGWSLTRFQNASTSHEVTNDCEISQAQESYRQGTHNHNDRHL
jgi:hypothetical protein